MRYRIFALMGLLSAAASMAQHNTLTPAEQAAGYELLFDGKAVATAGSGINWVEFKDGSETNTSIPSGWKVFPADSAFGKDAAPSDIRSKKKYKDFIVSFDFLTKGNSGFYYRTMTVGSWGWETGVEFAIEANTTFQPWIQTGAAYELIAANPNNFRKDNWNSAKIIVIGDSAEHWMNGAKVVAYRYWDEQWQRALKGQIPGLNGQRSKWNNWPHFCRPTRGATTGYIQEGFLGIQGDHGSISKFRNLKVAPLTQWPSPVGTATPEHRSLEAKAMLLSRIGWIDHGNGATLNLDFNKPYEATVRDISGSTRIPMVKDGKPRALLLDRANFRPGIYFVQVDIAGLILNKKFTLR